MLADYYAHLFHDDPKSLEDVEDDDFNPDDVAALIGADNPDDWETL